jgi:hypothetical protein
LSQTFGRYGIAPDRGPLIYIRDLLGHVSIRTTEDICETSRNKAVKLWEKAFQNVVPSLEEEKNHGRGTEESSHG